ncbi:MAG: 2-phosphosulfolactate phosphatase [Planctomycetaceae bacterium]|nr:2-phosphosulfolactate phosphatase [Planctomycetaceae bacterium]
MSFPISVHLLPQLFEPSMLEGGVAVILDILRASSTITTALGHGAVCVVPFEDVEDALQFRIDSHTPVLLGGERGGVQIEGFDLTNSPADYTPEIVSGRSIGFTTTNGTRALHRAVRASHVIIGSFLNLTAVVHFLRDQQKPVHLVCAGTNGHITGEDVLCAGAMVSSLIDADSGCTLNDSAAIALSYWQDTISQSSILIEEFLPHSSPSGVSHTAASDLIATAIRKANGGRNLLKLGFAQDIDRCSQINSLPLVPQFDAQSKQIRLM